MFHSSGGGGGLDGSFLLNLRTMMDLFNISHGVAFCTATTGDIVGRMKENEKEEEEL